MNDVPQAPVFYALTHATGGRWSWEEVQSRNLRLFAEAGVRLFQVDVHFQDIWLPDSRFLALDVVRRQIAGVLDACADAAVVLRVHVNAPFWWNERHREECTEYADGPIDRRSYGPPFHMEDGDNDRPLRASLASRRWRSEAGRRLVELCRRLARTPEGRAVVGIHVAGGIYGEWHYWGFIRHEPDTGPAMTACFRRWLRRRYGTDHALRTAWGADGWTLDSATVPDTSERGLTDDGVFKHPRRQRRVIDYFTCQQEVVADAALHFCRLVKDNWPRPILCGIFYGYYHMTFNRQTVGGHLCVERVLASPHVDYLAAPQTYWKPTRGLGGSGHARGVVESVLLHGKLWLDELDNGELQPDVSVEHIRYRTRTDPDYAALLRRSTLLPLLRGGGFWYYDFGCARGYGWWDSPTYMAAVRENRGFAERLLHRDHESPADVLVVWSPDVFYYLRPGFLPVSEDVIDQAADEIMRSGTASDHVFTFDLPRIDLDRYRLVMFMNAYRLTDEQIESIHRVVCAGGRTVVWNYLAGFVSEDELSLPRVGRTVGMSLRRVPSPERPAAVFRPDDAPAYRHVFAEAVEPMVAVDEPAATPLGYLEGTDHVIAARLPRTDHTVVFAGLPLHGPGVFRGIFREAGCHVYNEQNDFTYPRSGALLLHTADGGPRTIHLRGGRTVEIDLLPRSTVLLDERTGTLLL